MVRLVPRLRDDMSCFLAMFSPENPPIRYVRSNQICIALYGFGGMSGSGFGPTLGSKEGIKYRVGIWGSDDDDSSSKYRELCNLVTSLEESSMEGDLDNAEVFIFTDNFTAESVFFKGNSTSKRLLELMLRL